MNPTSKSRWLTARDAVDTEELAVIFGYSGAVGVVHSIERKHFPIPTFKQRGRIFALRSVVRAYFENQIAAGEQFENELKPTVDKRLISREKREDVKARKMQALETLARKLAQKELKRKEAQRRKYLKAIKTTQESVSHETLGRNRIG